MAYITGFNFISASLEDQKKFRGTLEYMGVKSQKLSGILSLDLVAADLGYNYLRPDFTWYWSPKNKKLYQVYRTTELVIEEVSDIDAKWMGKYWDMVVRMCPENPRHGILDNIFLPKEKVREEGIEQFLPQDCEAVVQPKLEGDNLVFNRFFLSIGKGTDGVTNRGESYTFPSTIPYPLSTCVELCGEQFNQVEIEAIVSDTDITCVQIRRTPTPVAPQGEARGKWQGFNFNGESIENYRIIEDLDDLAELESLEERTVLIHIEGSLNSHAAAWAREKGFPYIIVESEEEALELIKKKTKLYSSGVMVDTKPYKQRKYRSYAFPKYFKLGREFGQVYDLPVNLELIEKWTVASVLFLMSYLSGWPHNKKASFIAGLSASILPRIAIMLCVGEARHQNHMYSGNVATPILNDLIVNPASGLLFPESTEGRRSLYYHYLPRSSDVNQIKLASELEQLFVLNKWEKGYGGRAWGKIARLARQCLTSKTNSHLKGYLNKLINAVHNGGWFLNKVTLGQYFDAIAEPKNNFLNYVTAISLAFELAQNITLLEEKGGNYVKKL